MDTRHARPSKPISKRLDPSVSYEDTGLGELVMWSSMIQGGASSTIGD